MSKFRRGEWSNWAGNQRMRPVAFERPETESELSSLVERAHGRRQKVKAVGTGHSFTSTALTDGYLVDMSNLGQLVAVDRDAMTVTVGAGITIADLNVTQPRRHRLPDDQRGHLDVHPWHRQSLQRLGRAGSGAPPRDR